MPAATEYKPDDKTQREEASKELQANALDIGNRQKYYNNEKRPNLKDPQDIVLLGVVRQAIDRMVSFLVPEFPELSLTANETTDDETYLSDVWDANGGATLLSNIVLNGAKAGRAYVRVAPPIMEGMPPRIINLNPSNIITFWNADDVQRVMWHEIHWMEKEKSPMGGMRDVKYRQDIVDGGNQWWLPVYRMENNKWHEVPQKESVWRYPLPPILSNQHMPRPNEFIGEHEYGHVGLSDSINYIATNINRIIRFHAYPKTIGTGFSADQIQQTSVDGFMAISDANAKVFNVEMQSDLQSSMAMLNELKQGYFNQSRVVVLSGGLEAFRGMTNLGIRSVFMDMISKNETLRRQYGKLIAEVCRVLLMLDDRAYGVEPAVLWGEALPVDQREQLDLVQREMNMGLLSKRSAAKELGIDFDNEETIMIEESLQAAVNTDGFPLGVSA